MKDCEVYQVVFKNYPDVVDVPQMCEMLGGINAKTGYQILKEKRIQSFVVGRKYCIPKIGILQYLGIIEKTF